MTVRESLAACAVVFIAFSIAWTTRGWLETPVNPSQPSVGLPPSDSMSVEGAESVTGVGGQRQDTLDSALRLDLSVMALEPEVRDGDINDAVSPLSLGVDDLLYEPTFTLALPSFSLQLQPSQTNKATVAVPPARTQHPWKTQIEAEWANSTLTDWERWSPDRVWPGNLARWWSLVAAAVHTHGGTEADAQYMLRIMWCESGGLPNAVNPTSGASGLMQHMPTWWEGRSAEAGWARADVFDPTANIYVGAWLALKASYGGWKHWECAHLIG